MIFKLACKLEICRSQSVTITAIQKRNSNIKYEDLETVPCLLFTWSFLGDFFWRYQHAFDWTKTSHFIYW